DFSAAMLRQVSVGTPVRADMMRLPFMAHAFDVVICGLALGHAPDLCRWMCEIARVIKDGGVLLYSDFHPEAARAGLTRSFKDEFNRSVVLPHRDYGLSEQCDALTAAKLTIEIVQEL